MAPPIKLKPFLPPVIAPKLPAALEKVAKGAEKIAQGAEKALEGWAARKPGPAKQLLGWDESKLGPNPGKQSGWLQRECPKTTDVSGRMKADYENIKQMSPEQRAHAFDDLPQAKSTTYLMVPGLFTERFPGYMEKNRDALSAAGLDARMVNIDTDADSRTNAKVIRDEVLRLGKEGKTVVLVGQSKGGSDLADAIALYPEIRKYVKGAVAMQAPYGGTPVASGFQKSPELKTLMSGVVKQIFQGNPQAVLDLSYERRQKMVRDNPYPTNIPTVSLVSTRSSATSLLCSLEGLLKNKFGVETDGLVPEKDQAIPGSRTVTFKDMDHAESVMQGAPGFTSHDTNALTIALVRELWAGQPQTR